MNNRHQKVHLSAGSAARAAHELLATGLRRLRHELTRLDAVPTRGQFDRQIPIAVRRANEDSLLHCNGNAACFNFDLDDAMYPSWKATRDRKHSPKGRASLMREWLRLLAQANVDPADSAAPGWHNFPARALNSWNARRGAPDFSLEVKESMDGCLACKSFVGPGGLRTQRFPRELLHRCNPARPMRLEMPPPSFTLTRTFWGSIPPHLEQPVPGSCIVPVMQGASLREPHP